MTTFEEPVRTGRLTWRGILELFAANGELPLRLTAYDGSSAGPEDARLGLDLLTPQGTTTWPPPPAIWGWPGHMSRGPGDARVHPGDPTNCSRRWPPPTSNGHRPAP